MTKMCFYWLEQSERSKRSDQLLYLVGAEREAINFYILVRFCCTYLVLCYSTLLYATLRYSTLLYATLRYATQKLPTSKQIKNNNMILHLHLFCQTNTKMNNKLYNLDFYSVGCSTRSLRSNHVPHQLCLTYI
jgi:hypothetical protein